jgi:uncharacterized protein YycO
MKRAVLLLAIILCGCAAAGKSDDFRPGDIIFQTSGSAQSQAIQAATHSPYSHMGIILRRDGRLEVLEAVAQVRFTPLEEWIQRGEGGRFVLKRLKDSSVLGEERSLERLESAAGKFLGRPYDLTFEWSDERIYCSELVWKTFERGLGVRLAEPAELGSFDLSSEVVRQKIAERYGQDVPLQEKVISPAAILASPLLKTVR